MKSIWLYLAVALTVAGLGFVTGYQQATIKHKELVGAVAQQKEEARVKLLELTAERDKKQAALDELAKQQEETDNAAKLEIARLADELANRPIRVRVVTASGACSGSAEGDAITSAEAGTGNASSTSGILPEANHRRLNAALKEIESLSAAYGSCRARLLHDLR